MAGKSKAGARGRRAGAKAVSGSTRAGTLFPVGRCNRLLREGRYSVRHGASAGAFMAAVLEYITAECLELAGAECLKGKSKRIQPKHLNLAVRADAELGQSFAHCTLTQSS